VLTPGRSPLPRRDTGQGRPGPSYGHARIYLAVFRMQAGVSVGQADGKSR